MGHWKSPWGKVFKKQQKEEGKLGAIQKYVTARGGGGQRFCYILSQLFWEGGGILRNNYVTVTHYVTQNFRA